MVVLSVTAMGPSVGSASDEPHQPPLFTQAFALNVASNAEQREPPPDPVLVFAAEPAPVCAAEGPLTACRALMEATEDEHGLPRGLMWAVARRESGGGEVLYGSFNAWGYGPGRDFSSWQEAIAVVGARLAYWAHLQGLRGGLSTWVSGNPWAGAWYAEEVLAMMPAEGE